MAGGLPDWGWLPVGFVFGADGALVLKTALQLLHLSCFPIALSGSLYFCLHFGQAIATGINKHQLNM